ncbi:hypothetical protein, partial [Gordonia sp. 852002-50816_SCH5313054-a]|uniref:hypothetical protein n=1 Tax=Gordonia sp. 852002-50816_SCH5313054-a TaxID=1834091 RepID=UPI0018D3393C
DQRVGDLDKLDQRWSARSAVVGSISGWVISTSSISGGRLDQRWSARSAVVGSISGGRLDQRV